MADRANARGQQNARAASGVAFARRYACEPTRARASLASFATETRERASKEDAPAKPDSVAPCGPSPDADAPNT
eukprot:5877305-Lingulodinium_polyedra.AAC.1